VPDGRAHRSRVSLDDLWGASAHDVWDRVAAARGDTARLAVVEPARLARLARCATDRVTAAAVGDFVRSAGRASVGASRRARA
jgi:hypothetical protein